MNIPISKLWDELINYGYTVRKLSLLISNDKLGLELWQPVKNLKYNFILFDNSIQEKIKVEPKINSLVDYVVEVDDKDHQKSKINLKNNPNVVLDNTIPIHHFLVQHLRIPTLENNELNVVKFMQVAYNIGQFKGEREINKDSYPIELLELYDSNNLNKIDSYIKNHSDYYVSENKINQSGGKLVLYKLSSLESIFKNYI
jgi:hypothetical protein